MSCGAFLTRGYRIIVSILTLYCTACFSPVTSDLPELALLALPNLPLCDSLTLPDATSSRTVPGIDMTNNVLVLHFDNPPGSLTSTASNSVQLSGGSPVTTAGKFLSGIAGNGTAFLTGTTPPVTTLSAGTTMMIWVYRRSTPAQGYLPLYNGNSSLRGYGMIVEADNSFSILTGGNNVQPTGAYLSSNAWTHLALSVEPGNFVNAYSNGVFQGNFGLTITPVIAGDMTFIEFQTNTTDIFDEGAMWTRVLTSTEIQTIYYLQNQPCR